MKSSEVKLAANKLLAEGKISQALDFLYLNVDDRLKDKVRLLQSKFHHNKEQYELKMIIDKKEYDLNWSKIVNGTQNVIRKIDDTENIKPKFNLVYALVALVGISILIGVFLILPKNENTKKEDVAETNTLTNNFIGTWEAQVEHQGYLIDKGRKQVYVNDLATWIIEINPNHTAMMQGTIDTTGKSELTWFYNQQENSLRFIQQDDTSFKVFIEQDDSDTQKWFSKKVQGVKHEEWHWRLRRKS